MNRALNLCVKYCAGVIPDTEHDPTFELPFDMKELIGGCTAEIKSCQINLAVFRAMEAARDTNRFLTSAEPCKMKGSDEIRRPAIVRTTLEAIFAFMHFLAPVIPIAAKKVVHTLFL